MTRSDYPIKSLKPDDAVQLFLKAADMIGKTPTDNDTPKVEELCTTLLYGLPLALLLAAGLLEPYPFDRVYIKAKEEKSLIEAENYFTEEERHQKTLKALYEEHYQSLGEDEQQGQQLQALFRRLAIFVAPCRIKAVKAVCTINNDLPEKEEKLQYLLEMLARHFLITYDYENGWIAIMHNLLRIFARLKLQKNKKEYFEVLRKFIDYYRSLVTDYIDQKFNKEELEITIYLESLNGSFENISYTYKLNCFSAFPFIESKVKNILGEEAYIQDQIMIYKSENKSTDFSDAPDEISKQHAKWCKAVEKVCEQEQDIITHNPLLALWQDFSIKVKKIDMHNLTELYKEYGLYK